MTTVSTKAATPRRPPSASPTPTSSIARGATARSAVSPRVASSLHAGVTRRPSTKTPPLNDDAREALLASLKQETDQKEQLLVQLQDKAQAIGSLTSEVESLTSALHTTEARLNDLYTEQARSEAELAQRIDIAEKLRAQVRELEKEKRDVQRRYNEQTATFEAERQAFYDNEQHLKSRIQSVNEALKRAEEAAKKLPEPEHEEVEAMEVEPKPAPKSPVFKQDFDDPENEPAEMTALKLELSTLSTSYSSLQSTLVLLQSQLMDLKRVNNELQEDNESYMILLRERTLNGQFDLMRQVGAGNATSEDEDEETDDNVEHTDVGSLRSIGRSTLNRVDEEGEGTETQVGDGTSVDEEFEKPRFSRQPSRQGRKRTDSVHETRGESLADLPITGPGLDLAAELGRAENKDMLEGTPIEDQGTYNSKGRRSKKSSDNRKVSGSDNGHMDPTISAEMETMRSEIKSLKDANKALSLYASKIIDRIIAQEGFEHVLAADYDKAPQTPSASSFQAPASKQSPAPPPKPRPQSLFTGRGSSTTSTPATDSHLPPPSPVVSPRSTQSTAPNMKANRRSMSFDWRGFSLFNNASEKKPDSNLRPLTLKPGSTTLTGARKLDTEEDEEDRKERERLNATMKLMGIQPAPPSSALVSTSTPMERSHSDSPATATSNRRFSFFGLRGNTDGSDSASVHSTPAIGHATDSGIGLGITPPASLTQEALEHAEAENSLAALDIHERNLSAELAKGGNSGFTEAVPRQGRRSRKSAGGSGSTVWSAGMSVGDD